MALEGRLATRLISALLVGHLGMLVLAAIPDPSELAAAEGVRASADDAVSAVVRPVLDTAAMTFRSVARQAWSVTHLVQPIARAYVRRLGLGQTWNMFGLPPVREEYVRVRYFWTSGSDGRAPLMTATEMVFPKVFESQAHLVAFWDGHRDKAISNALGAYLHERTRLRVANPTTDDLEQAHVDSLKPVAGFFSSQFATNHFAPEDHFVRVEVWYGLAAPRARGDVLVSPQSRAAAIQRAYDGVSPRHATDAPFQAVDTVEREADIQWVLMFVKTP